MNKFLDLLLPWWWGPTNWITDSFISLIVLCALVSGLWFWVKTFRRRMLINSLMKETLQYNRPAQPSIKQELTEKFNRNKELDAAWQDFEDSLITRSRNENQVVYKTDEASLFFSEERLLDQHLNLRFWNSVPALLVGLGILGTFVGMVWGLIPFSDVDFTNTNQIREAIKELLSGVSTAFVTSVWGMLASFLFNGLEKRGIGRVSRSIADLQRALDRIFTLTRAEEIAMRQQDELTQQTAALKSFSTDLADRIKIAMDNIMSERLENLHQSLTQLHDQNTEGRQAIIQELHNAPEAFSSAMAEQLAPSFDRLNQAIEELRRQREESSTDAIRQLVEEFQNSLSGTAAAQMEELARTVGNASQSLMNLPGQMEQMIAGVQEQVDQTRSLLAATSEEQTEQMRSRLDGMLNAFQSAIDAQQAGLSETTDSVNDGMRQVAADIRDLLESTVNRADEQMGQRMADVETVSNQSIQTLQTAIAELGQSITSTLSQTTTDSEAMTNRMRELLESAANQTDEQLEQRMADIETVSNQSIQAFQTMIDTQQSGLSETTDRVNQEMTQIASDIRNLLESVANRTDEQFAHRITDIETVSNQSIQTLQSTITELQQSITSTALQTATESEAMTNQMRELVDHSTNRLDNIFRGSEQSISTLLQQQGAQTEAINEQLNNWQAVFTRGREMLEQMDKSVTNVRQLIETTRALSGQLMTGATQLENAGQRLTQASNVFNQENERYLTANRETTTQIQNILGESQRFLNDSVQRFQTIDNGLRSIFEQIERGLDEYATTSRESINTYLRDFSVQLTQASIALASSVEALNESVDILIDMIERLPS